jgi:hypothetical protein
MDLATLMKCFNFMLHRNFVTVIWTCVMFDEIEVHRVKS